MARSRPRWNPTVDAFWSKNQIEKTPQISLVASSRGGRSSGKISRDGRFLYNPVNSRDD